MYYVYDNPTYMVANKLICILYLVELNHLFTIMNDMSSDDNLSNQDINHSISLTLAQSDSDSLWWLISDLTFQLRDADCIMAEIREVMLLILTHYP